MQEETAEKTKPLTKETANQQRQAKREMAETPAAAPKLQQQTGKPESLAPTHVPEAKVTSKATPPKQNTEQQATRDAS
eukprot:6376948-Pyramimonas_sp.AAC.1